VGPTSVIGDRFKELVTLAEGTPADLVLFDPNEEWQVNTDAFASKGKNTPLDGYTLKGRVKLTIAGGEVVFDDLSV